MRTGRSLIALSVFTALVACTEAPQEAVVAPEEQAVVPEQAAVPGYSVPRTSFGHPDLTGIWQTANTAVWMSRRTQPASAFPPGRAS